MRCLDAGRPGDYLFRLPEFMQQRCCIDLYALAKATSLDGILAAVAGTRWERSGTAAERQAGPRSDRPGRAASAGLPPPRTGGAGPPHKWRHKRCAEPARPRRAGMRHLRCFQRRAAHPHRRAGLGGAHQRPPRLHGPDERRVGNTCSPPAIWTRSKARFARTKYGPLLGHHEYSVLKGGELLPLPVRLYCRKWRGSPTDPTRWSCCIVLRLAGPEGVRCRIWITSLRGVHYKLPSRMSSRC